MCRLEGLGGLSDWYKGRSLVGSAHTTIKSPRISTRHGRGIPDVFNSLHDLEKCPNKTLTSSVLPGRSIPRIPITTSSVINVVSPLHSSWTPHQTHDDHPYQNGGTLDALAETAIKSFSESWAYDPARRLKDRRGEGVLCRRLLNIVSRSFLRPVPIVISGPLDTYPTFQLRAMAPDTPPPGRRGRSCYGNLPGHPRRRKRQHAHRAPHEFSRATNSTKQHFNFVLRHVPAESSNAVGFSHDNSVLAVFSAVGLFNQSDGPLGATKPSEIRGSPPSGTDPRSYDRRNDLLLYQLSSPRCSKVRVYEVVKVDCSTRG